MDLWGWMGTWLKRRQVTGNSFRIEQNKPSSNETSFLLPHNTNKAKQTNKQTNKQGTRACSRLPAVSSHLIPAPLPDTRRRIMPQHMYASVGASFVHSCIHCSRTRSNHPCCVPDDRLLPSEIFLFLAHFVLLPRRCRLSLVLI